MKRTAVILAAALLMTACASGNDTRAADVSAKDISEAAVTSAHVITVPVTETKLTEKKPETEPETSRPESKREPAEKTKVFDARGGFDYIYTAEWAYPDKDQNDYVRIEQQIRDDVMTCAFWDMLMALEENSLGYLKNLNSSSYGSELRLKPREHEKGDGLLISIGRTEDGTEVFVIHGEKNDEGTLCLLPTEKYSAQWFDELCSIAAGRSLKDQAVQVPEGDCGLMDTEIAVIFRNTNFAWGVYDNGTFIDREGYIYKFDFAGGDDYGVEIPSEDELIAALEKVREKTEPYGRVNKDTLDRMIRLGTLISKDAEVKTSPIYSNDAGQGTFYIVTDRLIMLATSGDSNRYLDDKTALRLIGAIANQDLQIQNIDDAVPQ